MTRARAFLLTTSVVLLVPALAQAQNAPLASLLPDLLQFDIHLAPPATGPSHEAHFIPTSDQLQAPDLFNQQIVAQLATIPIGSPSGGFSFTFDPTLGTFERATNSFGPLFAERALTNGKSRLTLGTNFQHTEFGSFSGQDLHSGEVKFYLRHIPCCNDAFFEGDVIEAALNLHLSSTTTSIFANYGLSNRWDVAVAVPIVHVSVDADLTAKIDRFATSDLPQIHQFPGGLSTASFTRSGSASGVGDILVRTKYRFYDMAGGGLAAGITLRLPTGDSENLLGTGAAAGTFTFIGSAAVGAFSPHVNIEYVKSGKGDVVDIPDEFGYRFGADYAATPRVTLAADLIGRTLIDTGRLELGQTTLNIRNELNEMRTETIQEYQVRDGSLNLLTLATGAKVNVYGNLLLTGNVLFSLSSAGITSRVTPVIGLDYLF